MSWWNAKKYRMIQNNLRDIDAGMDIDKYIAYLKEFEADVCMVGCGGISSFYPTSLKYQQVTPYMKDDFFGELIHKCHKNNIKVIARFDFSKTHEKFLKEYPQWYTKSIEGNPILYNDTAATCVNGEYQQECSLAILEEVITKYPVDGVFFNMFGYQTWDYSNNYVGICQCDNCRSRFLTYSGLELPTREDIKDASFRKYQEFKRDTVNELLEKIYQKVKSLSPEIAVCTYNHKGVDLVRNESNSAVDRPYPINAMTSENNVSIVRGTFDNPVSSNCAINAVDIFYRFMGVSKYLNALRLYGNMASGGNLDWCIIGDFETYPDKENFEYTKRVFHFHKKHEQYFNQMQSVAKILLVHPGAYASLEKQRKEYQGIFKILKESHLLFDVIDGKEEAEIIKKADLYRTIILPAVDNLSPETVEALEQSKAVIVGTGLALMQSDRAVEKLFHLNLAKKLENVRSSYLLTEPKSVFTHFINRQWVYLDMDYYYMVPESDNLNYMPLVSSSTYGPPERCFGHQVTEQSSISVRKEKAIYFPWMIGSLYYQHGYEDFKFILLDMLLKEGNCHNAIKVDAPPCVEVFLDRCGKNQYLLQLLNYSGFNGTTFYQPLKIDDIKVNFVDFKSKKIYLLMEDKMVEILGDSEITLSVNDLYQAVLITTEEG